MASQTAKHLIGLRLSVMMFIQFFIWGAWYLSVSLYMYEHGMGDARYYAYTAGPLAAILAPFFTGLIADRFFNTERVLAGLFLLAGAFMLLLPAVGNMQGVATAFQDGAGGSRIVTAENVTVLGLTIEKGELFNWVILAHMLCYMPTVALTASMSFHNLKKGAEQFPLIRLWGTIGWIVAGFILALGFTDEAAKGEMKAIQFYLGGTASVVLGLYCLTLPRTPAPKKGEPIILRDLLFWDAWRQFRHVPFAVFMIGSFLVCIPLAAYYASLQQQMEAMDMTYIAAWKNTGTFLEAGMMFLMPFFFRRLGVKWMIVIGIGAWVLRYILFSLGASPQGVALVIAGIALHGICYDFFFVTGMVYVDKCTPANIRGQAQGMLVFFTQGLGLLIGAVAAGELAKNAFGDIASNSARALPYWPKVWMPLAGMATVIMIVFIIAFRDRRSVMDEASAQDRGEAVAEEAAP